MIRVILGAAAAAVAMVIASFLLFSTPLNRLGTGQVGNIEANVVQTMLKEYVKETGTYAVPDPRTAEQTVMYGQGPVATIHYNANGYPASGAGTFVGSLVLNFLVAMLIGFGLIGIDRRVTDFGSRAKLVVPFAFAATAFVHLSRPISLHHDWGNAIYSFLGEGLVLAVGGVIVAWFVPKYSRERAATSPSNAPMDERL